MEYPTGWPCERIVRQLELYLKRTIPRDESLAVAEHLEACGECIHRLVVFHVILGRPRG